MTELSHDGPEDGFHEIQLSGKQLVFLFMATTVVSVVIFLCGVLVGRGVRGDTVNAAESTPAAASTAETTAVDVAPSATDAPPAAAESGAPLTYPKRLDADKPPTETLKTAAESKPASKPEAQPEPPPPAPAPAATVPAPAAAPKPEAAPVATAGAGGRPGTWAVQVVALSDRAAAAAVVQRLTAKGYPAFVVNPQPGVPVQTYKVQVGKYNDRSEADAIRLRLKKEEQFEPIIRR